LQGARGDVGPIGPKGEIGETGPRGLPGTIAILLKIVTFLEPKSIILVLSFLLLLLTLY